MNLNNFLQFEPLISNGMSIFQMKHFVVDESITPYRKLRQALIEAKARLELLASGELDLQEQQLKLEKAKIECQQLSGIDQQLKEVDIKRIEYHINRSSTARRQQTLELEFFLGVIDQLIQDNGGLEKAKELFSNPEIQYTAETDYWVERLGRSVYSDFINYGTITKGVVESVNCLPVEQQHEIIQKALNQQLSLTQMLDRTRDNMLVNKD